MGTELALSFRQQIESNQCKSIELDETLKRLVLEKLNLTRAQGIILEEAQAALHPKEFEKVTAGLDPAAVKNYIKFARKHRDEITDFQRAMNSAFEFSCRASGLLPMPADGHGKQFSHDPPPFFAWASDLVMEFKLKFAKYLSCQPLDEWSKIDAEQFLFSLRPLLNVHRQVTDWLRKQ